MGKQSAVMKLADRIAQRIVAEQTMARLRIGFDGAIMAAHKVFQMGPGRSGAFREAYNESVDELAELFLSDAYENKDEQIDYAKGTRDTLIKKIVGEENFVPFDKAYGDAWMDELKRIRLIKQDSMTGWVSAADRLPAPFESVLISVRGKNGLGKPAWYVTIGEYRHAEAEWRSFTGEICKGETVTHWMLLPAPPEVQL